MRINLKRGYLFRYNNQTWKVTEVYKVKWRDGTKSDEYKVKSERNVIHYLEIETDKKGSKTYSFWEKQSNKDFLFSDKPLADYVTLGKAKFPKQINYNGVLYYYDETNTGSCVYNFETEQVDSIDYTNEDDTKLLSIELWDDEIEVSTGFPIKESDISNIQESKNSFIDSPVISFISKNIAIVLVFGFIVLSSLLNRCSSKNEWNGDSRYTNDSTQVKKSNNYYRSRNSRGSGK